MEAMAFLKLLAFFLVPEHTPVLATYLKLNARRASCPGTPAWGIWIDGRHQYKGPNAYGESYTKVMSKGVQNVYDMLASPERIRSLNVQVFEQLASGVGAHYRARQEPNYWPLACHRVLPRSYRNSIMKNVSSCTKGSPYRPLQDYRLALQELFAAYETSMAAAREDKKIHVIASLLIDLAYLHPFRQKNSRARVLLAQLELRRHGIACGTMLYNNGHVIYAMTEDILASSISEGIRAYDTARLTNFMLSPWRGRTQVYSEIPNFQAVDECFSARELAFKRLHRHGRFEQV